MKAKKQWIVAGIIGTLVLTAPLYSQAIVKTVTPGQALAATEASKNLITVTGKGEMTITPDVAYVNLGIQTKGATANDAQAANSKAFVSLEKVLYETYKLDKKDVKTSTFSVQPEYSYTDREPKIIGYNATQMLQVTFRDLDRLGTFLDATSAAGANRMNGVQFSTEKGDAYELEAIEKALDNAKAKAETIAKYAGKNLKGIVNVSQGSGSGIPVVRADFAVMEKSMAMDMAAPSTSISAGELKITTTVTVQYEF